MHLQLEASYAIFFVQSWCSFTFGIVIWLVYKNMHFSFFFLSIKKINYILLKAEGGVELYTFSWHLLSDAWVYCHLF